jgi:hypothetical protein
MGEAVDSSCDFLGKHTDSSTCFMVGEDLSLRFRFGMSSHSDFILAIEIRTGVGDTQVAQDLEDAAERGRGDGRGDGDALGPALQAISSHLYSS